MLRRVLYWRRKTSTADVPRTMEQSHALASSEPSRFGGDPAGKKDTRAGSQRPKAGYTPPKRVPANVRSQYSGPEFWKFFDSLPPETRRELYDAPNSETYRRLYYAAVDRYWKPPLDGA